MSDGAPFEGAVPHPEGGWTTPGLARRVAMRLRRRRWPQLAEPPSREPDETIERPTLGLADDDREEGQTMPDEERVPAINTAPSREQWEAAQRAAEDQERERQAAREDAELRGEEFMQKSAELRHKLLYGEINQATAERLHAALERQYPRADA